MATYQADCHPVKRLNKRNKILENLQTHLSKVHESGRKFIALFVLALLKVKTVNLDKIAESFDSKADIEAIKKRIHKFS
jgi:GGDEF domain-containing protein